MKAARAEELQLLEEAQVKARKEADEELDKLQEELQNLDRHEKDTEELAHDTQAVLGDGGGAQPQHLGAPVIDSEDSDHGPYAWCRDQIRAFGILDDDSAGSQDSDT